jgi:autoinducer 2-degrading protein
MNFRREGPDSDISRSSRPPSETVNMPFAATGQCVWHAVDPRENYMPKSSLLPLASATLSFTALALILFSGHHAAAQSAAVYINTVDLDIVPDQMPKFIELAKENGAASIQEPGCREFNVLVLESNPNHAFVYEVYDNEAALKAHLGTDHFQKFIAATTNMISDRNVRVMSPITLNSKAR